MVPRLHLLLCLLLTLALLALGCASGGGPSPQPPGQVGSGPDQTARPSSDSGRPLRIGYSPWPGWFLWAIVKEKNLFAKHGANAELVWFPVYSDSLQALATGQIDGNSQTLSDTLAPASKGIPLQVVLVNDNSAGGDGLVARQGITRVQDLQGKMVATELGTVDHLLLLVALDRAGLTEKDIRFVNMTVNDAGPAFIAGQLDAAVLWEPFLSKAVRSGKGQILFSSKDTPGLIPDLLVFKAEVVQERPEDVRRVLRAWFDALSFLQAHTDEALGIMARAAEMPLDEYRTLMASVKIFSLQDNVHAFTRADDWTYLGYTGRKTAEFLKGVGMLDRIPDVEALLNKSFIEELARGQK